MSGPVTYRHDDSIAVITLDDGKANVLGPAMQQAINDALGGLPPAAAPDGWTATTTAGTSYHGNNWTFFTWILPYIEQEGVYRALTTGGSPPGGRAPGPSLKLANRTPQRGGRTLPRAHSPAGSRPTARTARRALLSLGRDRLR